MAQMISDGIKVSSSIFYQEQNSNPVKEQYAFGYRIFIENLSSYPIRWLQQRFCIFDSLDHYKEAESSDVADLKPLIGPGERVHYESQFTLISDMGSLSVEYLFEKTNFGSLQVVCVPEMPLAPPFKNN
ncbi:ApaG domain [Chitinophagaceae bacterium 26-R-25]|nr:ApaG domain [Chitinophagaceae bacterium 26-R-25]